MREIGLANKAQTRPNAVCRTFEKGYLLNHAAAFITPLLQLAEWEVKPHSQKICTNTLVFIISHV